MLDHEREFEMKLDDWREINLTPTIDKQTVVLYASDRHAAIAIELTQPELSVLIDEMQKLQVTT